MLKKVSRKNEVKKLKAELKALAKEMGISNKLMKKEMPNLYGKGSTYRIPQHDNPQYFFRNRRGHKPSLKQRVAYAKDVAKSAKEMQELFAKEMEIAKQKMEDAKENEELVKNEEV